MAELAEHVGLSPFHFHRLFSAWAAVTPKDFLQCLTLSHVKALLAQGNSVLDAALQAGLSGPGRLHDLCVTLEAASPGEIKSCGNGWTVVFGIGDSPFGRCLIGEGPRGICHLSFVEPDGEGTALASLQHAWPLARLHRDDTLAATVARQIFVPPSSARAQSSLRAYVRGTGFQVRVWRALLSLKPGTIVSYGRLAAALGRPTAARAVDAAVAQNPLAYLIPCHRVIRETGVIGEYHWGSVRKRAIIAWENTRRDDNDVDEAQD